MSEFAPCPQCGGSNAAALNFTWWGGALGPRLLKQVKCNACGRKYNGKTGGDSTAGIVIYMIVTGLVAFALMFAVGFLWARM
jgi:uncharacterized protein (DUF983 family)